MSIQNSPLVDRSKLTYTSPEFPTNREIPSLAMALAEQSNFSLPPPASSPSMPIEDQIDFVERFIFKTEMEDSRVERSDRAVAVSRRRELEALANATWQQFHDRFNLSDESPPHSCCPIL